MCVPVSRDVYSDFISVYLQLCQDPSLLPASSPNELHIKPDSSPGRKDSVLVLVTMLNISDMMMSNM